ncbi:MAG: glycosyltransferase, partial [Candidatus Omnitrophica bacterium]|nr:glycosyltransferase [Candidatus Omnitrophota bacterium]
IIIDDSSTDGTEDVLKAIPQDDRLSIIRTHKNCGPAYARNRGIEKSKGQFIALIDSDCIAHPNWLSEIIRPFHEDLTIMITAGRTQDMKPSTYWELVNMGENFIGKESGIIQEAPGCNMAIRREFALRHPFDERITGGEDADLCMSCLQEGKTIFYNKQAHVSHIRRSTLRSTLLQQFAYGYNNAYARFKHKKFPFISYGAWIILSAISLGLTGFSLHKYFLYQIAIILCMVYVLLVLYLAIRPRQKNPVEIFLTFPGLLLRCVANTTGSLTYLCQCVIKRR